MVWYAAYRHYTAQEVKLTVRRHGSVATVPWLAVHGIVVQKDAAQVAGLVEDFWEVDAAAPASGVNMKEFDRFTKYRQLIP